MGYKLDTLLILYTSNISLTRLNVTFLIIVVKKDKIYNSRITYQANEKREERTKKLGDVPNFFYFFPTKH